MKLNPVWSKYDYIRGQKSIKNIAIEKILEDIRTERDIKSTRAHSALRGSVFGAPSRRSLSTNDYYVQRPLHSAYDTRSEEYAIGDSVLRATYLSDAVLDDTYDTSLKSRGRDQRLLSDATSAIPPSVLEPVKPSRARIGYKPLSRRSRNYPIFEKAMDRSPIPLSTSTLTASPRPFPSLPGSLLKYSSRYRGVTSLPTGVRRFTGVHVRPPMFEYEPDEKPTASMPPSPRLLGGYVSPRIVSRRYKSVLKSGQITPPYPYSTGSQRSTQLLGGYVSPKMVSAQHDIGTSPLSLLAYKDSGMQSSNNSFLQLHGNNNLSESYFPSTFSLPSKSQLFSPYSSGRQSPTFSTRAHSDSDIATESNHHPHRRHKVHVSKKHVSNYYTRLANKRAGKQGKSKYWPYYDVESIASSDVSDVLSDTESLSDYENTYSTGGKTYDIDDEDVDYVPFRPTWQHSPQGYLELSSHEDQSPKFESMSVSPYVPSTPSVSSYDNNTHDMHFNKLLSDSTARARGALSSLLRSYDDASLLMSVEGDAMSRHHDGKVGFRYYHPPVSIKGSGVESRHLRLSSFIEGQDDFLGDYVTKMRAIQNDVRKNLLRDSSTRDFDISPYSYEQRLRFMPLRIGSTKHVVPVTTFRKRLAGGLRHRLDVFHLPLVETVLPESPQQLMLSSTRGGNASLSPLKLSVLDKIKIKAALVASKVEVEPQRRRRKPHSQYAANKLRETRRQGDQDSYVPTISTTTMHASRPPLPMPSDRKAIRDVDGFTKPRNVLSWQYRLESRVNPTEVMYRPGVYNRMREQVRDAHEKLDRHRQLLDRYMNETGEAGFHRYQRAAEMDESSQSRGRSSSAPPAPSQPVMSELRRRLRKTICKSKRDPNYYRE
ncbi:uncharacterized protein LOC121388010 isoform X2 [Gigantopelta aegis]|uniref:uncharacterized protein LOC121388010 isoform X2 n=1 Tax=Gigantopelta aegis TaxID=1735272 RepID=UPI001B88C425|nr:uncharacterized protein LOC121388010 isoform X2 [Gigantopelta aegis]